MATFSPYQQQKEGKSTTIKNENAPREGHQSRHNQRGALRNRGASLSDHVSAHFYTTPTDGIRAICDAIPSLRSEQEAAASCAALRLSLMEETTNESNDEHDETRYRVGATESLHGATATELALCSKGIGGAAMGKQIAKARRLALLAQESITNLYTH